jgi:hypothetical protein
MKTWSWFTMGVMAGIILVLAYALAARDGHHTAYAQSAMGDGSSGVLVASGGVLQSANDIFWVLYKRTPSEAERKLLGKTFEGDRLTLCTYRAVSGGGATGQGKVMLISARDITYDMKLVGLDNETLKSVKDIKKAFEDAVKKADAEKR